MTDEITPALTTEEWARELAEPSRFDFWQEDGGPLLGEKDNRVYETDRHAIAAVALHGQPFGFTHEDVEQLREEARSEWNGDEMEQGRFLLSLADRIAALLPPPDVKRPRA